MATKKAPAKPAAKAKSTAVVRWDEALAARAQIAKKTEEAVSTGSFISLKSGQMTYNGNPVPGNKLECVVVDAILENHMYDTDYDPNNPTAPICYAFGRSDGEMAPHEKSAQPQHDTCKGCPNNEWGSAEKGRGKACKNVRRLGLIPSDALESGEAITDAAVAFLRIPVTSVKSWAGYVNQLAVSNKPPLAFVTEIHVTPDAASQFKVNFRATEAIDDGALIGALLDKADVVEEQIVFPYAEAEERPAKPARGRAAPTKPAAKPAPRRKF